MDGEVVDEELRLTLLQRIETLTKYNFELSTELKRVTDELIDLKVKYAQQREQNTAEKIFRL